jgi:hypothetical protein
MVKAKEPDITHARQGAISPHAPTVTPVCDDCRRIKALLVAFRDFGYSTLTLVEMREAYDIATTRKPDASDGIIAMLTRSQLEEAGLA